MKRTLLITLLLLALSGLGWCAYIHDIAFFISFAMAVVGTIIKIADED